MTDPALTERAARIAKIREWHRLLRRRYDDDLRVGGYVRDVGFLLTELAVTDSQLALIERAPTEPHLALAPAALEQWNRALFQSAMVIATVFARARLAGEDLHTVERKVQDAVKALRRGARP